MLSLAGKLLNLAVSSQDCTRNDLRRSKIPGGGPPDPPIGSASSASSASLVSALRAPLRRLAQSALCLTKLKLLPTGLN